MAHLYHFKLGTTRLFLILIILINTIRSPVVVSFTLISPGLRNCFARKVLTLRQRFVVNNDDIISDIAPARGAINIKDARYNNVLTDLRLTNGLLLISYDGSRFTGWSAGNDNATKSLSTELNAEDNVQISARKRRRARNYPTGSGFVRSVQGVLTSNLAKLYGNVDPRRIVVEGSSRTDKGVHARGMVAHFYCITQDVWDIIYNGGRNGTTATSIDRSIPEKRMPHPRNSTDSSYFEPIPKPLDKLAFALNRMCLDVRIMAIATTPTTSTTTKSNHPFHASKSASSKTYQYTFSVGPMHDPMQRKMVWHIDSFNHDGWNETQFRRACTVLEGVHDFSAFQGAPRGADDKRKRLNQDTVCNIHSIKLHSVSTWRDTTTYVVSVTGNRFLYKMVRFLVGACVAVGKHQLQVEDLQVLMDHPTSLHSKKLRHGLNLFECAPAHGLTLQQVHYNHSIIDWKPANM